MSDTALTPQPDTAPPHRLDSLLRPRSVAIVGASDKPFTNGHAMVSMCRIDGYTGRIYPINPRLTEVEGMPCYPDLASLPEVPEHVVIGVSSRLVESVLDSAIALGCRAATIFASCHLDDDGTPRLPQRIADKARDAGMEICGANCMGFYTPLAGFRVASMDSPPGLRQGGIAWIVQSGSALGALAHNDRRLGFTVCVSTGMELVTTAADYMDWALAQPETKVVGLFIETVRNPARFVTALARAQARGIPVVVLKVGRTETSARMAVSHTGAIAGNDAAYDALFAAYGVTRVEDLDEMAATLQLFEMPRALGAGGLATIHDSGGERELVADLASDIGLSFAPISAETCTELARHLEPGLTPENPLDAYGTHTDLVTRNAYLTAALANDANVALTMFMANPRDNYAYAQSYTDALIRAAGITGKPLVLASNYALADDRMLAQTLLQAGIPLLKGTRNALRAVQHLMRHRDYLSRSDQAPPPADPIVVAQWQAELQKGLGLTEKQGLEMLADFGLRTPQMAQIRSRDEARAAADRLGYPLVLKTAEDHSHKSDVGGVALNLTTAEMVTAAYDQMSARLGPRALLMQMAPSGVELALGALWDDSFGPVVMISAGGVLIEFLRDSVPALAPFDETTAHRLIRSLKCARLLDGVRGKAPANMDDLARQISAFSVMVAALGPTLPEIDLNPLICAPGSCVAVDCLVPA